MGPWLDTLTSFSPVDFAGVALLLICWLGGSWFIENPPKRRPSVTVLMARYRRQWMKHFVTRQPRIFDSQIVGSLRQSTAFFASTSMIAIGGIFALLGNPEQVRGVAEDLSAGGDAPAIVWEAKLLLILVFAANAFLKFVWSNRLFGYCSVMMGATPNDNSATAYARAAKAAEINIFAARSYNRGLRSVYFGIGSSAWLLGAWPLVVAALVTLGVILRREFTSQSREVLLAAEDE
ncbi:MULTISPECIES: DUF599 domain-containing protein [Roseobacteraceae]|uniref:DUF599 domain-containing protein n=1 Tax=Roseobacteraceae TaxID=2854170 RepID=UPI0013B9C81B|nr:MULTISPECIES: DUF599 domain-containing protein [Roseobacteraceae]MCA0995258.1 DUF599 domain-containing protein [Alloyangia pacifica]NDV98316.1 DUF599 domain-containing protein [Salipiger sp. PrR002]NDW55028.1 DUF599 domain-containing protein [Salipiger sp. PrR004]